MHQWESVTEGAITGPSIGSAHLVEKTEALKTETAILCRTTVFASDGRTLSVALTTAPLK
jgi:hypothetical protein